MIVIADTSPINFLVLIGEQELLTALFGRVILPQAVFFRDRDARRKVQKS